MHGMGHDFWDLTDGNSLEPRFFKGIFTQMPFAAEVWFRLKVCSRDSLLMLNEESSRF